jgi:cell division protein FtsL
MATFDYPCPHFDEVRESTRLAHSEYLQLTRQAASDEGPREEVEKKLGVLDEKLTAIEAEFEPALDELQRQIAEKESQITELQNSPPSVAAELEEQAEATPPLGDPTEKDRALAIAKGTPLLSDEALPRLKEIAGRKRAGAERKGAEAIRQEAETGCRRAGVGLAAVGWLSGLGLGAMLSDILFHQVVEKVPVPALHTVFSAPVLAALVAGVYAAFAWLFGTHLAAAIQEFMIARREPRQTPYIDALGRIYEIEMFGGAPRNESEESEVRNFVDHQRRTAVDGHSSEEAARNLQLHAGLFAVVAVGGALANFGAIGGSSGGGYLLGLLVAMLVLCTMVYVPFLASRYAVKWPPLPETLMDPSDAQARLTADKNLLERIRVEHRTQRETGDKDARLVNMNRELALLKEKLEKVRRDVDDRKAEFRNRFDTEVAKLMQQLGRNVERQSRDKLAALRSAIEDYEAHRGYSFSEQRVMKSRLFAARLLFWTLVIPFTLIMGVLATYPASVAAWDFMQQRFIYFLGFRVAPLSWLTFIALVAAAEWLIVLSHEVRESINEKVHTLNEHYPEKRRMEGLRYEIATEDEAAAVRKRAQRWLMLGVVGLLIETTFNFGYMIQTQASDRWLAALLSFVPLAFFVMLTFMHGLLHHRITSLKHAIEWASTLRGCPTKKQPRLDIGKDPEDIIYENGTGGVRF